jgi:hypothetical protein
MSTTIEEEVKRWTARRKSALVLEIIQGKTTVSEASRQYYLAPSEIEEWIEHGKAGMENALRAKPEDVREQHEREIKALQEAYGEAMLELRARVDAYDLLAIPTGELLPHGLDDLPLAGRRLQSLGHVLAELAQPVAATAATNLGRLNHYAFTRQMLREGIALAGLAREPGDGRGLRNSALRRELVFVRIGGRLFELKHHLLNQPC